MEYSEVPGFNSKSPETLTNRSIRWAVLVFSNKMLVCLILLILCLSKRSMNDYNNEIR